MSEWSEDELLAALRKGSNDRTKALEHLYTDFFVRVRSFIQGDGGEESDAKDVFQDALIIFYEKVLYDTSSTMDKPLGYLYGICRTLWRNHKSRKYKLGIIEVAEAEPEIDMGIVREFEDSEKEGRNLIKGIQQLGELCQKILVQYFYEKKPLIRVAESLGLKDAHNAGARKSRCEKKLREYYRKN